MADGVVIEHAATERLFRSSQHPGTRRLLQAVPAFVDANSTQSAGPAPGNEVLLDLAGITRTYAIGGDTVRACNDVSLSVRRGELLSLVGESGSGKSTLGRIAMALEMPDAGEVRFAGHALAGLSGAELRTRRQAFQPVFQDPLSSLNPRWPTLGGHIGGALRAEQDHFLGATIGGSPYLAPVEDALAAVLVNDAILRTLSEGGSAEVER